MYKVTSHASPKKWEHPEIPSLPLRGLLVGPSGTGKSCILSSMLNFAPYKKAWKNNVFCFSPTMREDQEYQHLQIPDYRIIDHYDQEIITELYEEQKEAKKYLKKGKELTHICIVLDDLITDLPTNQRSLLSKLFCTGRHLNISILIASQSYKLCARTIRMNLTCLIVLHCNQGEVKKISEESAASNFEELHEICTSTPYGFIVEIVNQPLEKRFRNKFTLEYLNAK